MAPHHFDSTSRMTSVGRTANGGATQLGQVPDWETRGVNRALTALYATALTGGVELSHG